MPIDDAPYPGLRPFRSDESNIFFGRDECIDAMLARLAATRFLAVLGSSGIGKSSLVKTGLLSALQMGRLRGAGSSWRVIDFRPGQPEGSPLRNLVRQLLEQAGEPARPQDIDKLRAKFLQDGPRALLKWCHEGHLPAGPNLLLLVDQFEELFRYQDYSSREEAEAFVALLLESKQPLGIKDPRFAELPIYVTLTMRSEFLGACSLIQNLPEAITEGAFLTPRMTREQYREAIVGPAEVCGIRIEDTLVNRLLNDLAAFAPWDEGEPKQQQSSSASVDPTDAQDQLVRLARRADQLPVLQHALNRIWQSAHERGEAGRDKDASADQRDVELTLDDYKAIGGLENALNAHANAVLEGVRKRLGGSVERAAERLFRALVAGLTPSEAVRRPTPLRELIDITEDEPGTRAVIEAFRANECNFLIPDASIPLVPALVIDISHESLIRQWKRLSQWVVREAVAAQQWRRLNDRFSLGEPLRGRVLDNLVAWREETAPNATWARRYGGDYDATIGFLGKSERAARSRRWIRDGAIAAVIAALVVVSGTMFYLLRQAQTERSHAEGNYAIAKDVLRNLTFDFARGLDSTGGGKDSQIIEVTDAFQKATASLDELAKANPNDIELRGLRARILDKFVDGYRTAGGYNELALSAANAANVDLRWLVAHNPGDTPWQTALSLNLDKIGDLKQALSASDAQASYEEAFSIDSALMTREPGHEDHPRQMAIELMSIGDLRRQANDNPGALTNYQQALALRTKLASLYSVLPIYHRDVSATLAKIADVKMGLGDRKGALDSYQEELKFDQQVAALFFGTTLDDRYRISLDLLEIAPLQEGLGDDAGALKSYQASLANDRPFGNSYLDNEQLQRRIATTANSVGVLQMKSGDIQPAAQSFATALSAELQAAEDARIAALKDYNNSTAADFVNQYGEVTWYSLLAKQPQQAANFAQAALKIDPSKSWIDINLAHAYLFLGRYDDAKAIYLKFKDVPKSKNGSATFAVAIRSDFDIFHTLGIATADFDRMAKEIGI